MRITGKKQSGLSRYIGTSKSILRKARDLYVHAMNNVAGKFSCASVVSYPTTHVIHLPKNFGGHNPTGPDHDQNLEELYQLLFKKYDWSNMEVDRFGLKKRAGVINRSYSVAVGKIGTIDEEEPCEFQEDFTEILFPRSRSRAGTMKMRFHY